MPVLTMVTHHGKERLLRSLAEPRGFEVRHVDADTDSLGTFSGEIERRGTPLETVIAKAALAGRGSPGEWRVASEGTFASDFLGVIDHEIVVALAHDDAVVVGRSSQRIDVIAPIEVTSANRTADTQASLERFVTNGRHAIVVNPTSGRCVKAIATSDELDRVVADGLRSSSTLRVELDLRAHLFGPRARVIEAAMGDLLSRLETPCSLCGEFGFGVVRQEKGAPCSACATPTDKAKGQWWACSQCAHEELRLLSASEANPAECPRCNP